MSGKYKPIQFRNEPEPQVLEWKPPSLGGGICLKDLEQNLLDDQSPRLSNVWFLNQILAKRYGQEWVIPSDITNKPILTVYEKRYKGNLVFACDTKLYKLDTSTGTATQIYTGLAATKGSFFVSGGNLYYINGSVYVKYDGTTTTVTTPYIPTTFTACPPTGGGTALEDENRYGAGQTNKFSGNGTATYTLSKQGLDATLVTATVGGVSKVETTDFTVNRTTGQVVFVVSPPTGTNNVYITFYKTNSSIINAFLACTHTILYGDAKETVFFGGNGAGSIYWSDVVLPNYIPLSNTKVMGDTGDDVQGFGIQYDTLVIFKPRTIYSANKVTTSTLVTFSFAIVNDSIGCDMPYSIQLINNRLTWCNTYGGVYNLTSTLIKDERNVKPLSDNVNGTDFRPGIFAETISDLQNATSCDWTKYNQYWLCVGSKVYMWDYGLRPYVDSGDLAADQKRLSWWIFNNVNANCFISDGDDLYYGSRTVGNFSHFINQFNDFGSAISSVYRVPLRDFGINDWYKTIKTMTITSRADTNTKINIEYINERDSRVDPQPITLTSFSWQHFSWAAFAWSVINFGKSFTRYPNSKHVLYWSVEFTNNDVGRDLSIINLVVLWMRSKKIR